MQKQKINLHIIERCNFACKYCFAHFGQNKMLRKDEWITIIDNCINSGKINEINFAGGEPLLHPDFIDMVKYIAECNKSSANKIKCSLITNGSLLNEEWIKENGGYFNTVGISVDSTNEETMKQIGRCDKSGKYISKDRLMQILDWFYQYHSNVKIKVNTTVNIYNKDEIFADCLIKAKNVKRWKLLKISPFENDTFSNKELLITDEEYQNYVEQNLSVLNVAYIQDNVLYKSANMEIVAEKDMKGAYLMVDSNGCLVDNTLNDNYTPLINCLDEPLIEGIKKLNFNAELYSSRYKKIGREEQRQQARERKQKRIQTIKKLSKKGLSADEIAKQVGCCKDTVYKYADKQPLAEKVLKLYEKGLKQKDIAKKLNCSEGAVSMILKPYKPKKETVITDLFKQGLRQCDIVKKTGYSKSTVLRVLRRYKKNNERDC